MKKIGIIADDSKVAEGTYKKITEQYDFINLDENDDLSQIGSILVLGGDGFMLRAIHRFLKYNIPLYGINCGTLGFLLNQASIESLPERLSSAVRSEIYPLSVKVTLQNGQQKTALAFNDISLLRETRQSARIKIFIDEQEKISDLFCDGVLVSTPAGSSAYNFSVHGPIIPLGTDLLALTPIAPFRPRQWRGALLPGKTKIKFVVVSPEKRPISAVADFFEFRDIREVELFMDMSYKTTLLFDHENRLEDKILKEQFKL